MEEEVWQPAYDGLWGSSWGRVKSDPFETPQPNGGFRTHRLSPTYGYWDKKQKRFQFRYRGKSYKVAPIICEAFNGKALEGQVCMHLDEDSKNNIPTNLEWGTQKQNLNFPGFLDYCRSRTGENSPVIKGRKYAK